VGGAGLVRLMDVVEVTDEEQQVRLRESIDGLHERFPHLAAVRVLSRGQRRALVILIVGVIAATALSPTNTAIGLVAAATALYCAIILNRVALFRASLVGESVEAVSDEDLRSFDPRHLPVYTVLIPAYKEPEVIGSLLASLDRLDYPRDKLDVKVLLEADDAETIAAAREIKAGGHMTILLVPPAEPRTKPKALNYGLSFARGDLVTIFDAEDVPDPLQLRKAAIVLSRAPADVACVQAKLSYANGDQNIITRWFTIEYAMWFSLLLPGLVAKKAPIPLGGTSNHFRRSILEAVGGWDPHNVTEDADLGIRLARQGYTVRVLESITYEEANSDFVNWVKQRSRWYKGYLQTWLLHIRRPRAVLNELGVRPFAQFNLFVGGTPFLAIMNPVFWVMTMVWFIAHPHVIRAIFPAPVFYAALLCWGIGNFLIAYLTILTVRLIDRPKLIFAALAVPAYWVMMSVAAAKAFVQLALAPSFWEKTTHGLTGETTTPSHELLAPETSTTG
jgi:cellulose synthase/poly-beta-1,6-N-acetylglucosamine synthase-like glycosyltransferase